MKKILMKQKNYGIIHLKKNNNNILSPLILDSIILYINLIENINNDENNNNILNNLKTDKTDDNNISKNYYLADGLKCIITCYKTDQFNDDKKFDIESELESYKIMLKFTSKTEELAKLSDTRDIMRIYCSFISNWIQMYQNDDLEG